MKKWQTSLIIREISYSNLKTARYGYLPMVSVKRSSIFSSLFFSKMGLEIMLSYGLERKEAFEDDKNVNFLNCKKWVFAKGVNPWFRSNNRL